MIKNIDSIHNNKLKHIRKLLESRKERKQAGSFVVEGYKSIQSLLEGHITSYKITEIFFSHSALKNDKSTSITDHYPSMSYYSVPDDVFEKLSDVVTSQGILAIVSYTTTVPLISEDRGLYVLVDSITDPGNLGTIIRSAVGAGFDGVLFYGATVDPYNPKTIRATMGTFAYATFFIIDDGFLNDLKERKYDIIIFTMDGKENIFAADYSPKTVIAVGNESSGISQRLRSIANRSIFIPMNPQCESLNAAVAGSIGMFQIAHRVYDR
ncbi:MAG: hypothetical protein DKM50_11130 [Candidatus Margulisiibacteriota bacterium]|nr:MAG: hypothetical protein A2X43_12360 [Candidatus Margulisbacteria bacterium GWD2_39_127]OGI03247.1 MAG: hypothetical protein A2X42_11600 [Candidatus Margulisbacteria bacterium GWF2_38_17]OGI11270.1 MAG: hypothetical protein A2X41_04025 [Candidatus Margulisbacteria bacterium GWE2_39_32]PZM78509.1 MAG: hypothetical protein DKM50_11130 [Candidatus Margulisiibacteriota bacterium]HAR63926.1 hypothetical protein [Candidatus Margulisiibacteriota bacterium]